MTHFREGALEITSKKNQAHIVSKVVHSMLMNTISHLAENNQQASLTASTITDNDELTSDFRHCEKFVKEKRWFLRVVGTKLKSAIVYKMNSKQGSLSAAVQLKDQQGGRCTNAVRSRPTSKAKYLLSPLPLRSSNLTAQDTAPNPSAKLHSKAGSLRCTRRGRSGESFPDAQANRIERYFCSGSPAQRRFLPLLHALPDRTNVSLLPPHPLVCCKARNPLIARVSPSSLHDNRQSKRKEAHLLSRLIDRFVECLSIRKGFCYAPVFC